MDIRLAAVLMCCLWSGGGCGLIMVGDPVQEMDLTSQDDTEENLKAIRAILEDQASRRPEQKPAGSSLQPSSPDAAPSLTEPSSGMRPLPSPSSSAGKPHVTAKLPWTPTAPNLRHCTGSACSRLYDPCARWTGLFGIHSLCAGRNGRPALRRTLI